MSDLALFLGGILLFAVIVYLLNWRGPRPPSRRSTSGGVGRAPLIAVLFLALVCAVVPTGCASPLNSAKLVVGAAAELYTVEEPRLEAAEKRALDACLATAVPPAARPACVEQVVADWAPTKAALTSLDAALHVARFGLIVAAAGGSAIVTAAGDGDLAKMVAEVLDAALQLQRLTAPKGAAPLLPPSVLPAATPAPAATPPPPATPAKGGAS